MNRLRSRSRRSKFWMKIIIHDLNNIPLASGTVYVRWHMKGSDARGRTNRVPIRDHKASWEHSCEVEKVRMGIDRDGVLEGRIVEFEVVNLHSEEKVILGGLRLNVAEYVRVEPAGRRYLLENSKVNSTLKITIELRQISGEENFSTPPMSSGQVFRGITGVMLEHNHQSLLSDTLHAPSIPASLNTVAAASSTPSLYRKTLTASWQRQDGELPAEEAIEDIFAGGDGWAKDASRKLIAGSESATTDDIIVGSVPNAGVDAVKRNGEIMRWAESDDLRSWVVPTFT
ncbi:N-terminal C2 in EEIG1 and EHBP1 proteins-domain-containing protein [Kockiozyma suomiensis]|uniref:N-terminal C2 in EEIG1 and EHBP1 proteins-domain-containing protein n=1 Tax=Kockiozyma suomiensis TaxID=1337062 RepID=UPI0033440BE2